MRRDSLIRVAMVLALAVSTLACGRLAADAELPFTEDDRQYWAFQPIVRSPVPTTQAAQATPIDAFIDARLEEAGLAAAGEADRRTLIRRATFDLHGLPPTPAEVQEFLNDDEPRAYERLIDRLLSSPRYGEHWARHWLDLVRYAESDGYKSDDVRPQAWRYRDWVIDALNDDKPFDRFVMEQLAGDELAPDDLDALIATGFLRLWPYESNGRDVADQRQNILNDITDVVGQVFLGLTIGCARCHDHKYDPLLQADYFRLQAFFAALEIGADRPLATPSDCAEHDRQQRMWEEATAEIRAELASLETPAHMRVRNSKRTVFPDYVQAILDTPDDDRSPLEQQIAAMTEMQLVVTPKDLEARIAKDDRPRWEALREELKAFDDLRPASLPVAMIAADIGPHAPETMILGTDEVAPPGFLSLLDATPASIEPPDDAEKSSGRRLALARWLVAEDNPLTARVIVNRIWQQHFGRGLVATPNDFGRQGTPPTHPELLDWLAAELIESGWHLKPLHRQIMLSAAYRRASAIASADERHFEIDPDNELYGRTSRRRLTAEQLRDAMLAASGELNLAMGGPSVRPELPEGISKAYAWKPTPDADERNRRSIYMFVRRNLLDPLLDAFDAPRAQESCALRQETNTAPQALVLLNGRWSLDRARALAGRVLNAAEDDWQAVSAAYRFVLLRDPTDEEITEATAFLAEQRAEIQRRMGEGEPIALPILEAETSAGMEPERQAALVDFCHVLLNYNELMYID